MITLQVINDPSSWHEWLPFVLVGVAALVYAIRQGLEIAGKSPSANLLRLENEDLVRRNRELEETLARHTVLIEDLQREVESLRKSSQEAVLRAVMEHEKEAAIRYQQHREWIQEVILSFRTPGGTA